MTRFPILFLITCNCATVTPKGADFTDSFKLDHTVDVGTVDEETMAKSLANFKALAAGGAKNVTLRIDSPGGSIFTGIQWIRAVEDIKKQHGIHVACVVDGMAYSMAAVILESPACDVRLATNRSTILFHNGQGGARGTAEEIKSALTMLEAFNAAMASVIAERLKIPVSVYRARVAHGDWVMAASDALANGVIDAVTPSGDVSPPVEAP